MRYSLAKNGQRILVSNFIIYNTFTDSKNGDGIEIIWITLILSSLIFFGEVQNRITTVHFAPEKFYTRNRRCPAEIMAHTWRALYKQVFERKPIKMLREWKVA